jgi:hypothetical protein
VWIALCKKDELQCRKKDLLQLLYNLYKKAQFSKQKNEENKFSIDLNNKAL